MVVESLSDPKLEKVLKVFAKFLKRDHGFSDDEIAAEQEVIRKELKKHGDDPTKLDYTKFSRVGAKKQLDRPAKKSFQLSWDNAINHATAVVKEFTDNQEERH